MPLTPRDAARAWYSAWSTFDLDALRELLAEDFAHSSPLGRLEGRDHYLATVEPMARQSVAELVVHEIVEEGAVAVARFTNRTPEGDVPSVDWLRVEAGRIVEVQSYYDASDVRATLGREGY